MQIREALVSAILDQQLAREEPIPSTRKMAKSLGVSRNTVVLAYQGLLDDGFLVAKQRSGYYVSEKAGQDTVLPKRSAAARMSERGFSRRSRLLPVTAGHLAEVHGAFRPRALD